MPERHTQVYIAQQIQDSIENWGLSNERITAVVHDNVASMNLAIKLIQNISDISCLGHTLQLAVTSGLGISTIHQFVSMAKKIVAHFRHSVIATKGYIYSKAQATSRNLYKVEFHLFYV